MSKVYRVDNGHGPYLEVMGHMIGPFSDMEHRDRAVVSLVDVLNGHAPTAWEASVKCGECGQEIRSQGRVADRNESFALDRMAARPR